MCQNDLTTQFNCHHGAFQKSAKRDWWATKANSQQESCILSSCGDIRFGFNLLFLLLHESSWACATLSSKPQLICCGMIFVSTSSKAASWHVVTCDLGSIPCFCFGMHSSLLSMCNQWGRWTDTGRAVSRIWTDHQGISAMCCNLRWLPFLNDHGANLETPIALECFTSHFCGIRWMNKLNESKVCFKMWHSLRQWWHFQPCLTG